MNHAKLLIYDDGRARLGPIGDLRSVLHVRSGITTNRARIERALRHRADAIAVPTHLAAIETAHQPGCPVNPASYTGDWIAINGRWTGVGEPPPGVVSQINGSNIHELLNHPPVTPDDRMIRWPWNLLDQLEATLAADLAAHAGPRVAASARVHPSAVLDETLGPIVIDEHAVVEPLAVLQGPLYVGPHTVIRPHANLRPHTSIGPACRVGGEVSFTIIEGCSNKAHLGYLGHAVVGRWVNLGADTNASNLKNTYASVRVHLAADQPPHDSARSFLGPVIGDHVRTAIGTRINTGCVLGTGSMIAMGSGFTPAFVPPMSFLTDAGRQPYDLEKFLATARTVLARRDQMLMPEEEALLRTLAV